MWLLRQGPMVAGLELAFAVVRLALSRLAVRRVLGCFGLGVEQSLEANTH